MSWDIRTTACRRCFIAFLPQGPLLWRILINADKSHRASSAHLLPPATAFALSPDVLLPLLERIATHKIDQETETGI
jgi:hypothetical protein